MTTQRNRRIYIIGAGFAGISIAQEIRSKGVFGEVAAFLDDDPAKIGTRIDGVPVLGPIADVVSLIRKRPTDEALIAIPGASREKLRRLHELLEQAEFTRIRILPAVSQIIDGHAHLIQAREMDPQDLLGRVPIQIGLKESLAYLRGRRVLVTGAGGSIGSELCRQLLSGGAQRLFLFGHGENSIFEIDRELRVLQEEGIGERATIVPVIGELQDRDYMRFILARLRADVVFHAAAYKHVPMLEANPVGAVTNNVFGTRNLVEAAREAGTERLVFISTDKVVNPVGVYAATKLLAEQIVRRGDGNRLACIAVRFGNVLGSRGSIIPIFRKQIARGGPLTITSPDASRFFMTIPEAASLVLKAGGVGTGGHLYALDMGEPVSIRELAEQMIRFYGYEPDHDIKLEYIGLRPGEKLSESLTSDLEQTEPTGFPRIHRICGADPDEQELNAILAELEKVCFLDPQYPEWYRNRRKLRELLAARIPGIGSPDDEPQY
ncbi:MAG: polysaccharide biosynthesis protein [Spirochaetaceae bacterium]|nr:MAG: polysaccharide biosynthesis protein [Spirochaetaceae bacterium]